MKRESSLVTFLKLYLRLLIGFIIISIITGKIPWNDLHGLIKFALYFSLALFAIALIFCALYWIVKIIKRQ